MAGVIAPDIKLVAGDGAEHDHFGYSVSISGSTAIVGAQWHDHNGPDSGAAYIFERLDSGWTEVAKLTGSDPGPDQFGYSVAISDGPGTGSASGYNLNGGTKVNVIDQQGDWVRLDMPQGVGETWVPAAAVESVS